MIQLSTPEWTRSESMSEPEDESEPESASRVRWANCVADIRRGLPVADRLPTHHAPYPSGREQPPRRGLRAASVGPLGRVGAEVTAQVGLVRL
ncbi:hypothetical protein GCM10009863_52910 [Streptomyces axinellae]|uniref:Uncharacterized protein n=1 Tax=Streptomyces axinellae TaxID=552788 RepID=A0ABN3QNR0_9ACTN